MILTSTCTEGKDEFQELMKEQEVKKLPLPGDRIFQMSEQEKFDSEKYLYATSKQFITLKQHLHVIVKPILRNL